jgi:DNA-binding CsgD family transcriptional regulator
MLAGAVGKNDSYSDRVIDGIYASIVEAASVPDLQRLLSRALDTPASTMIRIDDGVVPVSWIGFDPGSTEAYHQHYYRTDPWIAAGMTLPPGVGINVERLVSRDSYLKSEFYHDFMRIHGNATQLMGLMFPGDEARYSLTFMRVGGQPDFREDDEQRFARWSGHLRRAFRTRERIDRQRLEATGPDSLRADADVVHVLVNSDLAVRWMNRGDLSATPGIVVRQRPAGPARLEALAPHTHGDLLRAVHDATRRYPALSGAVRLGKDFILVDPCHWPGGGEPLALIHVPDRPAVEARAVERACGLFGLTAAEASLCRRLMRGDTVEEHATAMGLSAWTVRTHLRNVFGKTGTGRQAELVALLHRLAR